MTWGTRWHPVSGIFVQSWEKHRLHRCFPAAGLFSEPVRLQGHLRAGRVEPAPHLHFPAWGPSVRGVEGLEGGSVGLQPSPELAGLHEALSSSVLLTADFCRGAAGQHHCCSPCPDTLWSPERSVPSVLVGIRRRGVEKSAVEPGGPLQERDSAGGFGGESV